MNRRSLLAAVGAAAGVGGAAALAGCSRLPPPVGDPAVEFPEDPPPEAVAAVREFVLALGRGEYRAACRDRCRVVSGAGLASARPMDGDDLDRWVREAESWYGAADFGATSVELVDHRKLDPGLLADAGYTAGYLLSVRYEGTGRIGNPIRKRVVRADGDWWVVVGTLGGG